MSHEDASEGLARHTHKLTERLRTLSLSAHEEAGESSASAGAEECLRLMREALRGLPDPEVIEALEQLMSSFEESLVAQMKALSSATDPLTAQVLAARIWMSALFRRAPWCPLSERRLSYLSEELLMSLGFAPSGAALYAESLPSCTPALWVERGVSAALNGLIEQSDERPEGLFGLMISGPGDSAALAWAHRALLAQGLSAPPPISALAPWCAEAISEWRRGEGEAESLGRALLLDDLHLADRAVIWSLAELLSSPTRPELLIWSGEEGGFASALMGSIQREQLQLSEWTELQWRDWSTRADGERPAHARRPQLRLADQLRLSTRAWRAAERGRETMALLPREEAYEPVELLSASVGPLPTTRAVVEAQSCLDQAAEGQLSFAGFIQRGPSRAWGMVWEHPRSAQWGEALSALVERLSEERENEGERPIHAELKALLKALCQPSLARERWVTLSALKRLSHLTDEVSLSLAPPRPELESLREGLRLLRPVIQAERPHALSLGVLCGLAFDWAAEGMSEELSAETLEVLQLGVSAAERLGDPIRGGRLSLTLGKHALYEGLAELAKASLEAASQLLVSLRRPEESLQALSAWAEAELLSGSPSRALKVYQRAEALMLQLGYEEGRWPLRYKRGQLRRKMGYAEEALTLWAPLQQRGSGEPSEALTLELALAELSLATPKRAEAEARLLRLPESSLREALLIRCAALRGERGGLRRGLALIIELNQRRATGAWLTACELWSLSVLEGERDSGALEAVTRMLEEGVKGAIATRDRLSLISLYALLSACYQGRARLEEAHVARRFVNAWRGHVQGEVTGLPALRLLERLPALPAYEGEEGLERQVARELEQTLAQWRQPISALGRSTDET